MKQSPFYFEIRDVMTQFLAAFDDVVISRYNRSRAVMDKIQVRYVYSPKQRVVHDLVNKARALTLPVVAVSIAGIKRDPERVFNKLDGAYYKRTISTDYNGDVSKEDFIKQPVPVDIDVNMSILTKYQTDMDQILSNFIPYTNPYIVVSWKLPEEMAAVAQEIRSEVMWSGSLAMKYPTDTQSRESYRVSADTSFTIKSWLFPKHTGPVNTIFTVDATHATISLLDDVPDISNSENLAKFKNLFTDDGSEQS